MVEITEPRVSSAADGDPKLRRWILLMDFEMFGWSRPSTNGDSKQQRGSSKIFSKRHRRFCARMTQGLAKSGAVKHISAVSTLWVEFAFQLYLFRRERLRSESDRLLEQQRRRGQELDDERKGAHDDLSQRLESLAADHQREIEQSQFEEGQRADEWAEKVSAIEELQEELAASVAKLTKQRELEEERRAAAGATQLDGEEHRMTVAAPAAPTAAVEVEGLRRELRTERYATICPHFRLPPLGSVDLQFDVTFFVTRCDPLIQKRIDWFCVTECASIQGSKKISN